MRRTRTSTEGTPAPLPPVDPAALERAVGRVLTKPKPPGGWPGKPPKEVRADEDEEAGDGD